MKLLNHPIRTYAILIVICILAFVVRLYKFDAPLADWHSWRQTDTSAVSRTFVQDGFDILHPKYNDLSNIPSGQDNLVGYRFVEFPIYNVLQAGGYVIFGVFTLEQWGRIISILASVSICISLFFILKKYTDTLTGIIAAFVFAVLPFSIYYGRSVLPDQSMIAAVLAAIYFFSEWCERKKNGFIYYVLALFFSVISLLLKPYAVFFLLPIVVLSFQVWKFRALRQWKLWLFAILSVAPLILWRIWMSQFPEGIPANVWLFNEGNIRFKGAYFYWIFGERISKLILGYVGVSFVVLGLLKKNKESNFLFLLSFLLSSLLYVVVIARGNVQHDYYQILIVPSLVLFVARGIRFLIDYMSIDRWVPVGLIMFFTFLMLSLSWYHVRDYFNINNPTIVEVGKIADNSLPAHAKVIAPYGGDTTFLYQINRQGWPSFQEDIEILKQKGATHIVLVNPPQQDFIDYPAKYDVVASSSSYLIVSLQ